MPSFYDRYQHGERERVWSELIAQREAVRDGPVYSDACAVAQETMRRARWNIETLIVRLRGIGYEFGSARRWARRRGDVTLPQFGLRLQLPPEVLPEPETDEGVFERAARTDQAFEEAEKFLGGPLPISLRAWFGAVGHVSFIGWHPLLNPIEAEAGVEANVHPLAIALHGGKARWKQKAGALGLALDEANRDQEPPADPLQIFALEAIVEDAVEDGRAGVPGSFAIASDGFDKAGIGGDAYYVELPKPGMDVLFNDGREDMFVAYLRRVFEWGGFPGLERRKKPPLDLIRDLTRDLLAL